MATSECHYHYCQDSTCEAPNSHLPQNNPSASKREVHGRRIKTSAKCAMSLYYEGACLLSAKDQTGDLKSRVFGAKGLRSPPKQLFALLSRSIKWSTILKNVIERSKILTLEKKASDSCYSVER